MGNSSITDLYKIGMQAEDGIFDLHSGFFFTLIYIFKMGRAYLGGMFLIVLVVDVPSSSLGTF